MRVFPFLLLILLFIQCQDDNVTGDLPRSITLSYHQKSTLQLGAEIWSLEFIEINENSLCPPESVCIWLGRLVVEVKINENLYVLGIGDLQSGSPDQELSQTVTIDGIQVLLASASGIEQAATTSIVLELSEAN